MRHRVAAMTATLSEGHTEEERHGNIGRGCEPHRGADDGHGAVYPLLSGGIRCHSRARRAQPCWASRRTHGDSVDRGAERIECVRGRGQYAGTSPTPHVWAWAYRSFWAQRQQPRDVRTPPRSPDALGGFGWHHDGFRHQAECVLPRSRRLGGGGALEQRPRGAGGRKQKGLTPQWPLNGYGAKLPENSTNITLSGQNDMCITGDV